MSPTIFFVDKQKILLEKDGLKHNRMIDTIVPSKYCVLMRKQSYLEQIRPKLDCKW